MTRKQLSGYLQKQTFSSIRESLENAYDKRLRWIGKEKQRFSEISRFYRQLSQKYPFVRICKRGVYKIDPYRMKPLGEKGVDVAIATQMISDAYEKSCDRMVLISGDMDFVPAVKIVQQKTGFVVGGVAFQYTKFKDPSISQYLEAQFRSNLLFNRKTG